MYTDKDPAKHLNIETEKFTMVHHQIACKLHSFFSIINESLILVNQGLKN